MNCCSHLDEAREPSVGGPRADLARDLQSVRTVPTATDGSDADPGVVKGFRTSHIKNLSS